METPPSPVAAPTRKGLAIASLICGISALFCFPLVGTLLAIVLGLMAIRRARRSPAEFGGEGLAIAGMVTGGAGLVVSVALWAIFASMLLPALAKAKQKAEAIKCQNNLKQVSIASRIWALDHNDTLPRDFLTMSNELTTPMILVCPRDQVRLKTRATNWSAVTPAGISYEFLLPGREEAEVADQVVFRCPIHGHEVLGSGEVIRGDVRRR